MAVDPAVLAELGNLRDRLRELSGSVLATADGMVVAHDAHRIGPASTGPASTGLGSTGLGSTGLGSTGLGSTGLGSTGPGSIQPDSIAALAAAHLALARRFAHAVGHGVLRESVVQCDGGYLTSYTAGPNALLILVTTGAANLAMVHLEARRCVRRLVPLLTRQTAPAPRPEIPSQAGPPTPLARRTPMATLPRQYPPPPGARVTGPATARP